MPMQFTPLGLVPAFLKSSKPNPESMRSESNAQEMHDIESGLDTLTQEIVSPRFSAGPKASQNKSVRRSQSPENQHGHTGSTVPVYQAYHPYRAPVNKASSGSRPVPSHVLARTSSAQMRSGSLTHVDAHPLRASQSGAQFVPLESTPLAHVDCQSPAPTSPKVQTVPTYSSIPKPFIPPYDTCLQSVDDDDDTPNSDMESPPLPPQMHLPAHEDESMSHSRDPSPTLLSPKLSANNNGRSRSMEVELPSTSTPITNPTSTTIDNPAVEASSQPTQLVGPELVMQDAIPTPLAIGSSTPPARIGVGEAGVKPLTSYFSPAKSRRANVKDTSVGDVHSTQPEDSAVMDVTEHAEPSATVPDKQTKTKGSVDELLVEKDKQIRELREELEKMASALKQFQEILGSQNTNQSGTGVADPMHIDVVPNPSRQHPLAQANMLSGIDDLFQMDTDDCHAGSTTENKNQTPGPSEKALGKRRIIDGNDSDLEVEPPKTTKIKVPSMQKYSRPKGGVTIRFGSTSVGMAAAGAPTTASPSHADTSPLPSTQSSHPGSVEWTEKLVGHIIEGVFDRLGADGVFSTPKKKTPGGEVIERSKRQKTPRRSELVTSVRLVMNRLVGIKQDADILTIDPPSRQAIDSFLDDDEALLPPIEPLRFHFEGGPKHPWNLDLLERVYSYLKTKITITEGEQVELYSIALQRFETLQAVFMRSKPRKNETSEDAAVRVRMQHERTLDLQRPSTRRRTTWAIRGEVSKTNAEGDYYGDALWVFNSMVIGKLGAEGMSSDESESDGNGGTEYYAKIRAWRSPELVRYMMQIDNDKNTKPIIGKRHPGNESRKRHRLFNANKSTRGAVPGLPINFYNPDWLKTLPPSVLERLRPQPEVPFPPIP